MFKNEVDYRLAKWLILNMKEDGIISSKEMHLAWTDIAGCYEPPFLEVECLEDEIGDGVTVDGR